MTQKLVPYKPKRKAKPAPVESRIEWVVLGCPTKPAIAHAGVDGSSVSACDRYKIDVASPATDRDRRCKACSRVVGEKPAPVVVKSDDNWSDPRPERNGNFASGHEAFDELRRLNPPANVGVPSRALPIEASVPGGDRSVGRTIQPTTNRIHASPLTAYMAKLRSDNSKRTMMTGLKQIAAFFGSDDPETFPWWTLTYAHTNAVANHFAQKHRKVPDTARTKIYALHGVLKACAKIVDQDGVPLMTYDAYQRALPDAIKGTSKTKGRALERYEIDALAGACSGPLEKRDRAMLALLFGCGLRRSELSSATLAGYRDALQRVTRKGGHEADVPVPPQAREHVEAWIKVRGPEDGPLLYSCKGRVLAKTPMSGDAMLKRLNELAKIAGIEPLRPHDLRRTYISMMLDKVDPLTVASLVGHRSLQTTMKYDRRGEKAAREAAEGFDVFE